MTRTASINKDQLYRGTKPQSRSWMKKWLFRAAFVGALILGEHILKTSVHSDGWVNTVGGEVKAAELKKVDKAELAKTALAQLKEARESSRDKRPGMALVKSTPARNNFLETLSKLGLIEGTEPMDRFASYVKKFKNPGQSDSKSYPTAEKNIERELQDMAIARGIRQAVNDRLKTTPGKVTPTNVAGNKKLKVTPVVTAQKKVKAEPKATDAEMQAAVPDYKKLLNAVLDHFQAVLAKSDYDSERKNKATGVKPLMKKYLDALRAEVKSVTELSDVGEVAGRIYVDGKIIELATGFRGILKSQFEKDLKSAKTKDEKKALYSNYTASIGWLNDAFKKALAPKNVKDRDTFTAYYDIVFSLENKFSVDPNFLSNPAFKPISQLRGIRYWFAEQWLDISTRDPSVLLPDTIKAANEIFKQIKKSGLDIAKLDVAEKLVKDLAKLQADKKIDNPERQAERIRGAVTSLLVFAEAKKLLETPALLRTDLSDTQLAQLKENLQTAVTRSESIFDKEFATGLKSTPYPTLPAEIIIMRMNSILPPSTVLVENGYFKYLRNVKYEKVIPIEDVEKNALKALTLAHEFSKSKTLSLDTLMRRIGLDAGRSLANEFVVSGMSEMPIHREGADTADPDIRLQGGGMLHTELTKYKERNVKRLKNWGYKSLSDIYNREDIYLNTEYQKRRAAKGYLTYKLGNLLEGTLNPKSKTGKKVARGKTRTIGDLTPDEVEKLVKEALPKYKEIVGIGNLGYYYLITDFRDALKRNFGVGDKEDFVTALTAMRNKPEVSEVAKGYYDRAIFLMKEVDGLLSLMAPRMVDGKYKKMDRDLFNGSVRGMYANPDHVFKMLGGAATSIEDARREPKVIPPQNYLVYGRAIAEKFNFRKWYRPESTTASIIKAEVTVGDKRMPFHEYLKELSKENITMARCMVIVKLPQGYFILNPAYMVKRAGEWDKLSGVKKWLGKIDLQTGIVYKTYDEAALETSPEVIGGKTTVLFRLDKDKWDNGKGEAVPVKDDAYKKVEGMVTQAANEKTYEVNKAKYGIDSMFGIVPTHSESVIPVVYPVVAKINPK